jgi:circadian clock protein KaiC
MAEPDLVRTGIKGLDQILGGGIPRGNITLVEGPIGAGKTLLGVEFIYRGATEFNEPGLIVVFEMSPTKLVRDTAQFGWDLDELSRQGKIRIVFTSRSVLQQELQQTDSLLLTEAVKMGARRVFIDSLTPLASEKTAGGEPADARETFHTLAQTLQREGLTAMLTAEVRRPEQTSTLPEEFVADTVILLRMEDMQRACSRSLEIAKSRGRDYQMGRHTFRIIDGKGIEVYRRVQAPRLERRISASEDGTRITTGVPGLDDLVNGGYFPGSTTLIVGVSGVGKSVMALQYIAEGARRNERSLMLTLDEAPAQVLRNARTIGLNLPEQIERGTIQIRYDPPQEMEVDSHAHQIEQMLDDFAPTRVVIDSLSTYASNLGTSFRIFRDFFYTLSAMMRERHIAAVYNHENPEMLGMSSMAGEFGMSSLVDNIILMNWIELGDEFRLGLTVAKMRANPTRRITHECEIINGRGMRVLPRALPAAAPIPFTGYNGLISRSPARRRKVRPPQE